MFLENLLEEVDFEASAAVIQCHSHARAAFFHFVDETRDGDGSAATEARPLHPADGPIADEITDAMGDEGRKPFFKPTDGMARQIESERLTLAAETYALAPLRKLDGAHRRRRARVVVAPESEHVVLAGLMRLGVLVTQLHCG